MKRRQFFFLSSATAATLITPEVVYALPTTLEVPALDPVAVKEFVSSSHSKLDKVKALVEEHPHIINATWDWGDGDFENGLGAAGHMGHKEIANFLIGKGARPDIFVLTMLGKTKIVKAMLEEYPDLIYALGPHGFTILHHAIKGGTEAEELKEYIESKGMKDTIVKIYKK